MITTAPHITHAPPHAPTPRPSAQRPGSERTELPSWGQTLAQTVPLISAPAFFGPPVIFLLGPWLLLVLLLIGPFALLVTFVLALAAAVSLVAVCLAVIASPYVLIRHLFARTSAHPNPPASIEAAAAMEANHA